MKLRKPARSSALQAHPQAACIREWRRRDHGNMGVPGTCGAPRRFPPPPIVWRACASSTTGPHGATRCHSRHDTAHSWTRASSARDTVAYKDAPRTERDHPVPITRRSPPDSCSVLELRYSVRCTEDRADRTHRGRWQGTYHVAHEVLSSHRSAPLAAPAGAGGPVPEHLPSPPLDDEACTRARTRPKIHSFTSVYVPSSSPHTAGYHSPSPLEFSLAPTSRVTRDPLPPLTSSPPFRSRSPPLRLCTSPHVQPARNTLENRAMRSFQRIAMLSSPLSLPLFALHRPCRDLPRVSVCAPRTQHVCAEATHVYARQSTEAPTPNQTASVPSRAVPYWQGGHARVCAL